MRAIGACDHEQTVVTAGRGLVGRKQTEVLRCWRICTGTAGATCIGYLHTFARPQSSSWHFFTQHPHLSTGVQYSQHRAKVTDIVSLSGSSPLVASRDKAGEVHLWCSETGNQAALLANSAASSVSRLAAPVRSTPLRRALPCSTPRPVILATQVIAKVCLHCSGRARPRRWPGCWHGRRAAASTRRCAAAMGAASRMQASPPVAGMPSRMVLCHEAASQSGTHLPFLYSRSVLQPSSDTISC